MSAFSTQKREDRRARKILPLPLLTSREETVSATELSSDKQMTKRHNAIAGSNKGQNRDIYFNETTFCLKLELLDDHIIDVTRT